jgi:hypothetical protein
MYTRAAAAAAAAAAAGGLRRGCVHCSGTGGGGARQVRAEPPRRARVLRDARGLLKGGHARRVRLGRHLVG